MDFKSLILNIVFSSSYIIIIIFVLALNIHCKKLERSKKKEDNIYEVYYESEGKFMCIVFISMFTIFFIIMLIISLWWK